MKPFSLVIWSLWGAVVLRVLLTPFWGLTAGKGAILLLVAAPAVGLISSIGVVFRHVSREQGTQSARP